MSPSLPSFFIALALSLILAPTSLAQRKTLPYNFTLAAVNTTLPNANRTGVPLVLGSAGAVPGASFYITSTYASYPYNDYPTLGLVNGQLRAYDRYGQWHTNASGLASGNEMGWLSTTLGGPASNQFAAFHATRHHRYASLAVHATDSPSYHYTDSLWSLCPSTQFRGKNEVVYNVSATYQYYPFDVKDCYRVTLQVVPLRWWADDVEGEGVDDANKTGDVDGLDGGDAADAEGSDEESADEANDGSDGGDASANSTTSAA